MTLRTRFTQGTCLGEIKQMFSRLSPTIPQIPRKSRKILFRHEKYKSFMIMSQKCLTEIFCHQATFLALGYTLTNGNVKMQNLR